MSRNVERNQSLPTIVKRKSFKLENEGQAKMLRNSMMLMFCGTILVGCQQLGLRPSGYYVDEDDWGAPPSNVSQVPRPYIETKRNKQSSTDSAYKTSLSDQAIAKKVESESSLSPSSNSVVDSKQDKQPLKKSQGEVVDTGDADVDLDSALEGLPPQYQEMLKRQLAASKKLGNGAMHSLSDSTALDGLGQESPADKVSMRLSDTGSVNTSDAVVTTPTPKEPAVVAASASNSNSESANLATTTQPNGLVTLNVKNESAVVSAVGNGMESSLQAASATVPTATQGSSSTGALVAPGANPNVAAAGTANIGQMNSEPTSANVAWNQSVVHAINALEKQIEGSTAADENLRLHQELTLRMLYASLRKPEEAMQPIPGLSDEENEYYRNQMMALIEASNPDAMPVRSRHLSLVMDSQRKATGFLAAASNLEVRNMAFCTDVERYGVITKFPKYHFKPDEEVLLYCEIENVSALPVKDGFESQLQGSYEILDSNGNRIVEQTLPMEPDVCQNVRRDYYMVYRIFLPQQISPGNYKLRLTVEDLKARKYGQSTLDLQIKK